MNEKRAALGLDLGILILRLGFGFLMLSHGLPKLQKLFAPSIQFADPLGLGIIFGEQLGQTLSILLAVGAEVGCSILLIVGALTRLATLPLIITMAVAAFIVHGGDPLSKKESALHFLTVYICLLGTGAGRFSVDTILFGKPIDKNDEQKTQTTENQPKETEAS